MNDSVYTLIALGAGMFVVIGGLSMVAHYYTLGGIKSKTVGDGQHGTARFAAKKKSKKPIITSHVPPKTGAKDETVHRYKALHQSEEDIATSLVAVEEYLASQPQDILEYNDSLVRQTIHTIKVMDVNQNIKYTVLIS